MKVTLEELINEAPQSYMGHHDLDADALCAELAQLRQKAHTLDWLERQGRLPAGGPEHRCDACGRTFSSEEEYHQHRRALDQHMLNAHNHARLACDRRPTLAAIEPPFPLRWEADRERK